MTLAFFLQNILNSATITVVHDDASKPIFSFSDNVVGITPPLRPYLKSKKRKNKSNSSGQCKISVSIEKRRSRRGTIADLPSLQLLTCSTNSTLPSDHISIKQEQGVIDSIKNIISSIEKEIFEEIHNNSRNDQPPKRPSRRASMSHNEMWKGDSIESTTVTLASKCSQNSAVAGVAWTLIFMWLLSRESNDFDIRCLRRK